MLSASVTCPEASRLRQRYVSAPRVVGQELQRGMRRAAEVLQAEVQVRAPESFRPYILVRVTGGGALIQAEVVMDQSRKPYAGIVERGSRPHLIRPRPRSTPSGHPPMLRFTTGGRVVFVREVRHPGTRGRWMFRDGFLAALPKVRRTIAAFSGNATRRLGTP